MMARKPGSCSNVLLPYTTAKLSLRLPPTLDPAAAGASLKKLLEDNAPSGATVTYTPQAASAGWNAPALAPWLEASLARAAAAAFGAPPAYMGEGGSIPFMAMLGEKFPDAQFVVTGVLGPHSNAHGPNEFLHLPTGRRVQMNRAGGIAPQGDDFDRHRFRGRGSEKFDVRRKAERHRRNDFELLP